MTGFYLYLVSCGIRKAPISLMWPWASTAAVCIILPWAHLSRKAKPHSSLCLQSYKPSRRQTVDSPSWNLGGSLFREDKPAICGFIHLFCPWEAGCWEPCSLSLCHCHCVCCNHRAGHSHRLHVTQRHIHCKRSSHVWDGPLWRRRKPERCFTSMISALNRRGQIKDWHR